jgi:parallel beta-helix repeat protein
MTGTIDPALFGMPDATTTGVLAGTTLTAYSGPMTITTPGTVIEGKIIDGTLLVTAANVTIKNCVVQNYGWWGIDAENAANITVQNCDFTASASKDTNAAILGSGTFIGNDISHSENGIVLTDGASVVRDNYIHDLFDNFGDPHIDGISVQGGQNHVLIEHNTIESWDTSCIFIKNDFGPINDITVRNNLLYGDLDRGDPSATIYVYGPNTTNVSITNNYVEKGNWYYYATENANPTISGNIEWNNRTDTTPYPTSSGSGTGTSGTGTSGTGTPSGTGTSGTGTSGTGTSGTGTSGSGSSAPTPPAAPKIASVSTDTGVVGDHITSDKTLTLTGSAAANSTVKVYDNGTWLATVAADSSGAWHYTTTALSDGKQSFTTTDTVSGATSSKSAALDVTVDTTAPNAPVLLSDATHHHRATVTGTAEAGSTVNVYEGTSLLGTGTTGADGHFSVTTSGLTNGSHTFVATANDAAGNTSSQSNSIDPPIGSHSANGTSANGTSTVEVTNARPHWDHTATIKGTADANSQIKVFEGDSAVGTTTANAEGLWHYSTSSAAAHAVHTYKAQELDDGGHVVASSGSAILGSHGNNTLESTAGNDLLVGHGGHDTFVFAPNFGHDVIKDFAASGRGQDFVQFSKSVFDNYADVLAHATQSGHDVVIAPDAGDSLTLKHVKLAALEKTDFHFA